MWDDNLIFRERDTLDVKLVREQDFRKPGEPKPNSLHSAAKKWKKAKLSIQKVKIEDQNLCLNTFNCFGGYHPLLCVFCDTYHEGWLLTLQGHIFANLWKFRDIWKVCMYSLWINSSQWTCCYAFSLQFSWKI